MTTPNFAHLAETIQTARLAKGYSAKQLAERAGVTPSTITRIEHARLHQPPRPENLITIARVLGLSASDLFASLGWLPKEQLPGFDSYLRCKYADLPEEAVDRLCNQFSREATRYGYNGS